MHVLHVQCRSRPFESIGSRSSVPAGVSEASALLSLLALTTRDNCALRFSIAENSLLVFSAWLLSTLARREVLEILAFEEKTDERKITKETRERRSLNALFGAVREFAPLAWLPQMAVWFRTWPTNYGNRCSTFTVETKAKHNARIPDTVSARFRPPRSVDAAPTWRSLA